jgi:nucleoside-diphosphate-sugar epimerase
MAYATVTGAAGFIGSHLVEELLRAGWRVRGIDGMTTTYDPAQKCANLAVLRRHPGFEFVEADLAHDDLAPLLEGSDAVAHLAAEAGVAASWGDDFRRYAERNVVGTQRLLEAATVAGVRRVVYASSSSVYGEGVTAAVAEDRLPRPSSPYGASKFVGEMLVGAYAEQRGLHGVSLRYFSVYGPRQRPDMAAHRFIEAILDGRPLTLYGNGSQMRDFTYVADIVAATAAALSADLHPGTVLNVATGAPVRVGELVRLLAELADAASISVDSSPERPGDVGRTHGSSAAAAALLGWSPRTPLREGLAAQVAWHRARRLPDVPLPSSDETILLGSRG